MLHGSAFWKSHPWCPCPPSAPRGSCPQRAGPLAWLLAGPWHTVGSVMRVEQMWGRDPEVRLMAAHRRRPRFKAPPHNFPSPGGPSTRTEGFSAQGCPLSDLPSELASSGAHPLPCGQGGGAALCHPGSVVPGQPVTVCERALGACPGGWVVGSRGEGVGLPEARWGEPAPAGARLHRCQGPGGRGPGQKWGRPRRVGGGSPGL